MTSSYNNSINSFAAIFKTLVFFIRPKKVVEFGILHGFSLRAMADATDTSCQFYAYDIFDEFNGNGASKDELDQLFQSLPNIHIEYGDFTEVHKTLGDSSVDIIHVDIANTGDTYNFAVQHYLQKLTPNGVLLLEGGTYERDNVYWMSKYDKAPIRLALDEMQWKYDIFTIHDFPSLTMIRRKRSPLVSVVIPSFERFEQVQESIRSVLNQTVDVEVIVVDDCSQDPRYLELDELYPDNPVRIIHLPENTRKKHEFHSAQGLVKNIGIKHAKGEWIAFLDDDDVWTRSEKLEVQIKAMVKHNCKMSSTNMFVGHGQFKHNKGHELPLYHKSFDAGELLEEMTYRLKREDIKHTNHINNSTVIIHRDVVANIGVFKMVEYEDYEYWKRVMKYTDCIYIHRPLAYYDLGSAKHYQNL